VDAQKELPVVGNQRRMKVMTATTYSTPTDILGRVIDPQNPTFTREAAQSVLALQFPPSDVTRMNELAEKARGASLVDSESEELNSYLLIGSVLDLMHSKARISLKKTSSERNG